MTKNQWAVVARIGFFTGLITLAITLFFELPLEIMFFWGIGMVMVYFLEKNFPTAK